MTENVFIVEWATCHSVHTPHYNLHAYRQIHPNKTTACVISQGHVNNLKSSVSWYTMPCIPLKFNRQFGETHHLQSSASKNRCDISFRNVGWILTYYKAFYPRGHNFSLYSKELSLYLLLFFLFLTFYLFYRCWEHSMLPHIVLFRCGNGLMSISAVRAFSLTSR